MAAQEPRKRTLPLTPPWERKAKDHRRTPGQQSPSHIGPGVAPDHGSNRRNGRGEFSKEQVLQNQIQEAEQMREWVAKEDDFVLKQSKKKARIRVREGRARSIDWLAVTLLFVEGRQDSLEDEAGEEEMDVIDPSAVIETLDLTQSKELEKDIDTYLALEKNRKSRDYWNALKVLCRHQEAKSAPSALRQRTNSSIRVEIDKLFGPKSLTELVKLEEQISIKLQSNEPIDVEYWENLLHNVGVFKAKAELKAIYRSVIEKQLRSYQQEQRGEATEMKSKMRLMLPNSLGLTKDSILWSQSVSSGPFLDPEPELRLRPQEKTVDVVEENAFVDRYNTERRRITNTGYLPSKQAQSNCLNSTSSYSLNPTKSSSRLTAVPKEDFSSATNALYEREVARGVQDDEEIFAGEEEVSSDSRPQWAGKYRPRKPRYFNRVQMGYEWNKYNQTHYDHDNPPPKVVQGYKFNIFYPDLIQKDKAPTYRIEREGGRKRGETFAPAGEEDTCLIRFISGPPYEDIAFRIVDKEWDFSAKRERGFRSSFDKGILQLHFQFKKVYYRK